MTDSNRVFFDTNPLIYYLEDEGEYGEKIAKLSGCSIFLSNDKQLEGYSDVSVLTIGKI